MGMTPLRLSLRRNGCAMEAHTAEPVLTDCNSHFQAGTAGIVTPFCSIVSSSSYVIISGVHSGFFCTNDTSGSVSRSNVPFSFREYDT